MKNAQPPTILLVLFTALLGLATPAIAAPVLGPTGNYYVVVPVGAGGITWDDANAAANASVFLGVNGHLATITSAAEDVFVDTLRFTTFGSPGPLQGEVWLGGFQSPITETVPSAGWTWVNGEGSFPGVTSVTPYANWGSGEPNDAFMTLEQYLAIGISGPVGMGWNDEGFFFQVHGYAVEYETSKVPEQGSLTVACLLTFVGIFAVHGFYLPRHKTAVASALR